MKFDVWKALKEGWSLYKAKFLELLKWVVPIFAGQLALAELFSWYATNHPPSFLLYSLQYLVEQTLQAVAIFVGTFICLTEAEERFSLAEISAGRLFVIWFTTVYIGIAMMLGLMLFVVPGIVVFTVSMFYAIYIVRFEQGPIESVASSTDIAKNSWFRLFLLAAILFAGYFAAHWVAGKLALIGGASIPLGELLLALLVYVATMYGFAVTVASWRQLRAAT